MQIFLTEIQQFSQHTTIKTFIMASQCLRKNWEFLYKLKIILKRTNITCNTKVYNSLCSTIILQTFKILFTFSFFLQRRRVKIDRSQIGLPTNFQVNFILFSLFIILYNYFETVAMKVLSFLVKLLRNGIKSEGD